MKKFTKMMFKVLDTFALVLVTIIIWEACQHYGISMGWCGGIIAINTSIFTQRNK